MKPWGEAQGYRGGHEDVPAGQVVGGAAGDHVVSFGAGACFPRAMQVMTSKSMMERSFM